MQAYAIILATALLGFQADPQRQALELIEKLRSDKIEEREQAERELIRLGSVAKPQIEGLMASTDPELRLRARRILEFAIPALTPEEKKEVDALLLESRVAPVEGGDPDKYDMWFVDQKVWDRWTEMGTKPTRYLLELHQDSTGLRRGQLLYLAARSKNRAVLGAVLEGLYSSDAAVRLYAVSACEFIGDPCAVPILVGLLKDNSFVHQPGTGLFDTVSRRAAWAIDAIVGFPVDPDLWVEFKFPVDRAHHGMAIRVDRIQAWWERNNKFHTREEWQKADEEYALSLIQSNRTSQERLSGCLLLLVFGNHDDQICQAVFEVYRDARMDGEEHWRRRRCLGFLVNESSSWLKFKGRPGQKIESFLLQKLQNEPLEKDRTAALGLSWELCSNMSDFRPNFGKSYTLASLRPLLRRSLDSKDPVHHLLAALTLAFYGERDAEPFLIDTLKQARPDNVETQAPWLASASRWTDRGPMGLSFFLLHALEGLRSKAARDAMRLYADHPDVHLRVRAWEALARIEDKSILPAIRDFLDKREGDPDRLNGLWRDAVNCLYLLSREEALRWYREEFKGKRELTFFHWLLANLLVRNNEPLAVELWIATPTKFWSGAWQEIPTMRPDVLMPGLIDLVGLGNAEARKGLSLLAPQENLEGKTVEEFRAWWRTKASTFTIAPRPFETLDK